MSRRSRPAILVVLTAALLLSSGTVGVAVAGPSNATDVQPTDDVDGEAVIDAFVERIETLETAQFTRATETTFDGNTTTRTVRVAADLDDFQKRTETVNGSFGTNSTTVVNESKSVTYFPEENSLSEYEVTGQQNLLPSIEALANESMVDYEFDGTETIDGQETYVVDATVTRELAEDVDTSLTVYLDTETYFPTRMVTETSGPEYSYSSTVTYTDVTLNEALPDSTFELDVPDDVNDPSEMFAVDVDEYDARDTLASNVNVSVPDAELADGFSFEEATVFDSGRYDSVHMTYSDGDRRVSVTTRASTEGGIDYDEHDRYEAVEIGDTTGYVYSTDGYTLCNWETNQTYSIYSEVDSETVIDVAESISQ